MKVGDYRFDKPTPIYGIAIRLPMAAIIEATAEIAAKIIPQNI